MDLEEDGVIGLRPKCLNKEAVYGTVEWGAEIRGGREVDDLRD